MAKTAIALLEDFAAKDQRFFLSVHQSRPHTPLIAPRQYVDMYDPDLIPDPPAPPESLRGCPYPKRVTGGNPDLFMLKQPTPRQAKEAIAAYYACVSFVDDNVGRLLDSLEAQGLADNTIVFVMGDHGFHLGDHAFWSKYSMYEATRRAPLWVRVPGAAGNGRICREFVEFVDLLPTVADLAGLDTPANLEGVSFAPLLANPELPWKQAVFMVQAPQDQMVRDHDFSYLEFPGGQVPAALYDLREDPWETVNLADDPRYAATRERMSKLLKAGGRQCCRKKVRVVESRSTRMVTSLCRLFVPRCLIAAAAPLTAAPPSAERIITEAGITKGICSVPNCGDGSLALDIARHSEFLVHAFDRDLAQVECGHGAGGTGRALGQPTGCRTTDNGSSALRRQLRGPGRRGRIHKASRPPRSGESCGLAGARW